MKQDDLTGKTKETKTTNIMTTEVFLRVIAKTKPTRQTRIRFL